MTNIRFWLPTALVAAFVVLGVISAIDGVTDEPMVSCGAECPAAPVTHLAQAR